MVTIPLNVYEQPVRNPLSKAQADQNAAPRKLGADELPVRAIEALNTDDARAKARETLEKAGHLVRSVSIGPDAKGTGHVLQVVVYRKEDSKRDERMARESARLKGGR